MGKHPRSSSSRLLHTSHPAKHEETEAAYQINIKS